MHIRLDGKKFISPLLDCDPAEGAAHGTHPDLNRFREILGQIVRDHLQDESAETIALYFRDLRSGYWFGINEEELFPPASLMKVPLMIAIFKRAEREPGILEQKLRYQSREARYRVQSFKPKMVLKYGSWYTVDDLVFRMIAYSDNDATMLLADHFGMGIVDEALAELHIPVDTSKPVDYISLRHYAAFFRMLYNASYLSHDLSEKALTYLSRSTFDDGISSGVPEHTSVANKFGEHSSNPYYLSDCGIVYYPEHPYLVGIVTKGGSQKGLTHVMEEISRAIYQEYERQHLPGS